MEMRHVAILIRYRFFISFKDKDISFNHSLYFNFVYVTTNGQDQIWVWFFVSISPVTPLKYVKE